MTSEIEKIKKRDGRVVDFNSSKIADAIYGSMTDVGMTDYDDAEDLARQVVDLLEDKKKSGELLTVEEAQDAVEKVLIKSDQAEVAKAFILYRQERKEIRDKKKQILEKEEIDQVDKTFDANALRVLKSRYLKKDEEGNLIESPAEMFERVAIQVALPSLFYDPKIYEEEGDNNFPTDDIKIEEDLKVGDFELNQYHKEALIRLYRKFEEKGQMKESWGDFLSLLKDDYFDQYAKEIEAYYDLMTERKFIPNTPALVNFGRELGMGLACFVLPMEDSLEGIMDALKRASIIFKSGGGVGYNFSRLRPEGDYISSTGGESSGPISFMTLFDKMTDVVKQGGIRRGASMGIMNSDHPDVEDFITAKKNNERLNNFNLSVFIKEDFWEHYEEDKPYPLKNPRTGKVVKKVDPEALLDLIVYQGWESAEPGVIFDDNVNEYNPFLESLGRVDTCNPCVTDDSWVMTSEGPRQVKELIGEKTEVIVDGEKWSNQGEGFFKTGTKKVFKLKTEEGFELKLTDNHPLKKVTKLTPDVKETSWKQVKQLESGDRICVNHHEGVEWEGNHNKKEGYLTGLLVGDGNISNDKAFIKSWGESEAEQNVREVVKEYMNSFTHRSDFNGWYHYQGDNQDYYEIKLAAFDQVTKDLNLDSDKRITPEIEKGSSDFYKGFLRGFFDADASVQGTQEKGVSIRLAQSDMQRLKAVQRMLLRLGIYSKIYSERREPQEKELPDGKGGTKKYHTKAQHELVIANENLKTFYERIGFNNSDKQNRLESLLDDYKRSLNRERFIATIKEITPLEEREVYDIKVPGINAFDANGLHAHNCGESVLYPNESCDLGAINVWAFVEEKKKGKEKELEVDWEGMKRAVRLGTRFLDNVLDVNKFPLEEIEEMSRATRKIGLGMMGLGNFLYELGLPYDSEEGRNKMEEVMEFINYYSKVESISLAKNRGKFPYYDKSFFDEGKLPLAGYEEENDQKLNWDLLVNKIQEHGLRNAYTTIIAPTGSTSMIAGTSSGMEPVYSLVYEKKVSVGSFYYVNPVFEKVMEREGLFDDDLVKNISDQNGSCQDLNYIPPRFKKRFVTAMDISGEDHVRALASIQKWVDSSVSKTINFPADASASEMKRAYLLGHKLGCKDLTVFRNKSMQGVLEAGGDDSQKEESEEELESLKDNKSNGRSVYSEAGVNEDKGSIGQDFNGGEEEQCPECDSDLVISEGCKTCPNCGWSACSVS